MTEMGTKKERNIQIIHSLHVRNENTSWFRKTLDYITVEPSLLLCILPSTMYQSATVNLYLEKSCRVHLSFNQTVCDSLSERRTFGYETEEALVQDHVAVMSAISTFIQGFFPFCLILFLGSWSDENGRRRPLIISPILGEIVAVSLLILNTVYFKEIPVIFSAISLSLPTALSGGWPCLFLGVYSYISSLTDENNKTVRIGVSSTIQNVAFIIGLGSSGFLLEPLGFTGIYTICLMMLIISFLYGYFKIDERKNENDTKKIGTNNPFLDIFRVSHLKNTLKTCCKSGKCNRKKKIFTILILCFVILGPVQGENAVCYLYTRLKFGWDELDFSIFFLVHSFFDMIGCSLAIIILTKILKWKDISIGILAVCSIIMAEVIYAFGPTYEYFYAGIIPDIFFTVPPIVLRSMMAKVVPENELGRSNSVLGLSEAFVPLIFGPLYSGIYKSTIEIFPGTFYFISIFMYCIGIFVFIYFNRESFKDDLNVEENEGLRNHNEVETKSI